MKQSDRYITNITVDLDAIAHNVRALAAHVGPETEIFAVIKANAYGHGAPQVARVALENGATHLAVGFVDEAIELRRAGITAPILVMCYTLPEEAEAVVAHNLTVIVNTIEGAQAIDRRSRAHGKVSTVHVKVDTGMGRYGLLPEEMLPFVEQISALPNLDLEGFATHFARADLRDQAFTRMQLATYMDVLQTIQAAGHEIRVRHTANSAATLGFPETHLDAVRPGIAIYGLYPSPEIDNSVVLKPALTLRSHVARVRTLPAGSNVSYGQTFVTTRPTTVALVPGGYGDGYHRFLSNRGHVLVRGQKAPIAGRLCMDQFVVDVTGIEGVQQDDEVVLLGKQGNATISAEELAELAGTISYEMTTGLMPRVPRIYVQGGEVVEVVRLGSC